MTLTFPAQMRLQTRADHLRVYRQGQSRSHAHMVLYHAPSSEGANAPTRFGITVSKKVDKRATARNRIRRVWKEAIRLNCDHFKPGRDIVINARAASVRGISTPQASQILLDLAGAEGLLADGEGS